MFHIKQLTKVSLGTLTLFAGLMLISNDKVQANSILPSTSLYSLPKDASQQTEQFNTELPVQRSSADVIPIGNSTYTRMDAVDIASYQYQMTLADFQRLKNLGVKTAIVKVSEGTYYRNGYARNQISLARQAGLNIAVYHYSKYTNWSSGVNEGRYAASTLKSLGLGTNTLIFSDIEDKATYTAGVKDGTNGFWQGLKESGYNNYAVYTYQYYPYRDAVVSTVGKGRTWIAQYPYTPTKGGYYERQWRTEGYGAWQFSSTAYIPNGDYRGYIDVSTDFNGILTGTAQSTNVGVVDSAYINGKSFHVSGWHAADASEKQKNAYIIAYDATNNKEIGRVKYEPTLRQDVANSDYGYLYNAKYSGYSVDIPIPEGYQIAGKNIQFIMRYSADINGNTNYTDVWSKKYNFNSNYYAIDSFSVNSDSVHVSGWHISDASSGYINSYILIYDATTGHEITKRVKYTPTTRTDVAKAYPNVYNSSQSGFNLDIPLTNTDIAGHKIQVIMRNSDNATTGEGAFKDLYSNTYTMPNENKYWIDNFNIDSNNIVHVSGWHASDSSKWLKNSYILIYDATTGHEITKRVKYTPTTRTDVAKAYPNVYNSSQSGFNLDIPLTNTDIAGHKIQVIMRNSDNATTGEGAFKDLYSNTYTMPNENRYWIDNFNIDSNNIVHVSGWHISDISRKLKNSYILIYDATTGHEITKRVKYTPTTRTDVAKAYPNVYNSSQSGFNLDIPLTNTDIAGHKIQVIMRNSDNATTGEGIFRDIYSNVYIK